MPQEVSIVDYSIVDEVNSSQILYLKKKTIAGQSVLACHKVTLWSGYDRDTVESIFIGGDLLFTQI